MLFFGDLYRDFLENVLCEAKRKKLLGHYFNLFMYINKKNLDNLLADI